jgi:hypothetical protein
LPPRTFEVDERPYKMASATYDIAARKLKIGYCGPNTDG